MVKIRLRRIGAKKKPSYRLVVADSRAPRNGTFIEVIGHYDPLTNPATITIDKEKVLGWLKQGAQPTATVGKLLLKAGVTLKPKLAQAATGKKTEPTKAGTKRSKPAKAGVSKKSKPAKEKA